jgi:chromosome partitioning protein
MPASSGTKYVKVCSKCGAEYGFGLCRDGECPIRHTRANSLLPGDTSQKAGAHVIVLGNEKGGSGKSTVAMHLIIGLMKRGFSVASLDLDAKQGTLSRYVQNRKTFSESSDHALNLPEHRPLHCSDAPLRSVADNEDRANLSALIHELAHQDFIVIDTPGGSGPLARLGLTFADTLITPLNDSFIDLDLLARVDAQGRKILTLGPYGQRVLDERHQRSLSDREPFDWIVLRNRLAHIDARNKRQVGELLELLGNRLRFRSVGGFGERVVFRELFPKGLTLLDLRDEAVGAPLSISHVAARQELRSLLNAVAPRVQQNQSSTDSKSASCEPSLETGPWISRILANAWRSSSTSKHKSG